MIIDTHLHLPAVSQGFSFDQSKEKLLSDMRQHHIDYAIVIPDNLHDSVIGDVDVVQKLIENDPNLFMLGTIDVSSEGTEWLAKLDLLFQKEKLKGIKIFPGHDPIYPTDMRLTPVYELCMKYDYPIVVHTGWNTGNPSVAQYNDPKHLVDIAEKFPELKIVIAHYFWPKVEYCYRITRGIENIYFDTSALADEEVIAETGIDVIKKVLEQTISDIPESVMFGTDYAMCDFESHINLIDSLEISNKDKQRIMSSNAIELFKLNIY